MAKKRQKDDEPKKRRRKDDDDGADEKPKSNLALILVGVGALLLCCCGVGGVGGGGWFFRDKLGLTKAPPKKDDFNKDAIVLDGPKDRDVDNKPGPKIDPRKPDFVTTAEALFKEFDSKDNSAAKAKYQGKIIEVTGEVQNVVNRTRFTLVGDKTVIRPGVKTHNISCEVMPEYEEKAVALAVGQKVKVIGRYKSALILSVRLSDCSLEEFGQSNVPLVSLDEIAAEYDKSAKAAKKKYDSMDMIVTGVIEKIDRAPDDSALLTMKTARPRPRVFVVVSRLGALRTGQQIEFRANMPISSYRNNELHIIMRSLVRAK
jgi:hypothetical protein